MNAREWPKWLAPRLPAILVVGIVAVVLGFTMAISYEHEFELAYHNHQVRWVSGLVPFSVDGLLLVASIALYWAGRHGIRHPVQPLVTGAVGILATIAANMFSDLHAWWLGPAVAASSGVAAVLVSWVAFWLLDTQRRLAAGESVRPAADCACPPPPTSLAEVLPVARAELLARGLPAGEQKLADRFGTTRNQVRAAWAAIDAGRVASKEPGDTASPQDVAGAPLAATNGRPGHSNGDGSGA